ncbi:MAG: RecX family transcriptional regulator [Anaerolineaceae bacterium]|nr:RecX family transcriptional regulator [Anaerolineaceae bacterium]
MSVITKLEIQKKNKERANVYLDGDYAFSVDIMVAAGLQKGQQLSDVEIEVMKDEDAVSRAVDRAVRYLAYRPRSTAEVRRNLADKQTPEAVIEAAVERLNRMGYLDDQSFARFWVDNRNQFKPLSERALRYELRQKGVPDSVIASALDDLDANDAAYRAAQSRVRSYRQKTRTEFRNKMSAFLQRRGFNFDVIRETVEQLIAEIETEDTEFFISDEE